MVVRIKITLEEGDYSRLLKLALSEIRTPEGQIIHILRKELDRNSRLIRRKDSSKRDEKSLVKQ
jgi:hypothetical protein